MNLIKRIEHKTDKEIKELYREFMDLPRNLRFALDFASILLLFFILTAITPPLRYSLLNFFGDTQTIIKVVDSQERLPIIDAKVMINQKEYMSDADGLVKIDGLGFGEQSFDLEKPGYESIQSDLLIEKRENSFEQALQSNGTRVVVEAKQLLSDESVDKFLLKSDAEGGLSAAGTGGRAVMVIPGETTLEVGVEVMANGFMKQNFALSARQGDAQNDLIMVPEGEHYFLASRGGATTVYRSNLDGGRQERLIEPTGFESANSQLFLAPNSEFAVFQAVRRADSVGAQLHLVNLKTKEVKEFDSGFPVWQILDVSDTRVVYVADSGNPSDNKNQRLKTYNFQTGESKELIASPQMSYAVFVGGKVVFAEQIERGSFPGGYLLRQLMSVDGVSGEIKKLSQDATITDIRVVAPDNAQYSQINPQTGAEVKFVYDTGSGLTFQAPVDRPNKQIFKSPFESNYFAWTTSPNSLSFGDGEMNSEKTFTLNNSNLEIKRWPSKDYLIVHSPNNSSATSGMLIRTDNGRSAPLP
jgi:hypothetical protein